MQRDNLSIQTRNLPLQPHKLALQTHSRTLQTPKLVLQGGSLTMRRSEQVPPAPERARRGRRWAERHGHPAMLFQRRAIHPHTEPQRNAARAQQGEDALRRRRKVQWIEDKLDELIAALRRGSRDF